MINGTDFSTPLVKNEAERISYGDSNVKVALDSLTHIEKGSDTSRSVTFAKPFNEIPTVTFYIPQLDNFYYIPVLSSVSKTGFTYKVYYYQVGSSVLRVATDACNYVARE